MKYDTSRKGPKSLPDRVYCLWVTPRAKQSDATGSLGGVVPELGEQLELGEKPELGEYPITYSAMQEQR
jgi:hypothetical protein